MDEDEVLKRTNTRYTAIKAAINATTMPAITTPAIPPALSELDDEEEAEEGGGQLSPTATSLPPSHATRTVTSCAGSTRDDRGPA